MLTVGSGLVPLTVLLHLCSVHLWAILGLLGVCASLGLGCARHAGFTSSSRSCLGVSMLVAVVWAAPALIFRHLLALQFLVSVS